MSLLDSPAGAPTAGADVTAVGAPAMGASLLGDAAPAPPAKKPRERKPKAAKETAAAPAPGDRVLPAPKGPTEVEVAKAAGAVEAAQTLGGRERISHEIRSCYEAEEQALAAIPGEPGTDVEERALHDALASHEALLAEHERAVSERLRPFLIDAASIGHALDEIKFWEAEAARINRLYEAHRDRARQRAERAERMLWPWVKAYCTTTARAEGKKSWTFPTTLWTVVDVEDHAGSLKIEDHQKAALALQKLVGPEVASKAIKVEWMVYVKESLSIMRGAKIEPSKVSGFKWTPPGGTSLSIRKGR